MTTSLAARFGPRTTARLAVASGVATLALLVAGVVLAYDAHQVSGGWAQFAIALPFTGVGVVVARRHPRNIIGWIMLTIGLLSTVGNDTGFYSVLIYRDGHTGLPLGRLAVGLTQTWIALLVLLPLPIALFPDGRLPSPRWRWTMWVYLAATGGLIAGTAYKDLAVFTDRVIKVDSSGELATLSASGHGVFDFLGALLILTYAVVTALWIVAQLSAFRRATGERRQQLKWLISGGCLGIFGFAALVLVGGNGPHATWVRILNLVVYLAVICVPLGIGVGIMKYRLYDIDRLVSRTLSYALVTGLLVGVYFGIVTLTTRALPLSSPIGVAASTLIAAALFTPLRRRAQRLVDRRFNRARYDADATIAAFSSSLRDEVDLATIQNDLLVVVRRCVEPTHASVWIRG